MQLVKYYISSLLPVWTGANIASKAATGTNRRLPIRIVGICFSRAAK